MALLSVVPDPDILPEQAVAQAMQLDLMPAHIRVHQLHRSGAPIWRWSLVDGAPHVRDPEVTVYPGIEEQGHWRQTAPAIHPELRGGVVVATAHGWVVVATDSAEETTTELVEQALAHVAAIEGS